jgi:hypothetical protein
MEKEFRLHLAKRQCDVAKRIIEKLENIGGNYRDFIDDEILDIVETVLETLDVEIDIRNGGLVIDYITDIITFDEMIKRLYFGGDREWVN